MGRLVANPAPVTALAAGLIVFAPGVTFIAAVQVVATSKADLAATAEALILVTLINVFLVWLPLIAHFIAPDLTNRTMRRFNAWLRANGRVLLSVVMLAAGVILTVNGATGLVSR